MSMINVSHVSTCYNIISLFFPVKDGVELSLTSGRMNQTSTGLEVRSLTGADSGLYRCTVTNVAGSASSEATLLVHGGSETRVLDLSINFDELNRRY